MLPQNNNWKNGTVPDGTRIPKKAQSSGAAKNQTAIRRYRMLPLWGGRRDSNAFYPIMPCIKQREVGNIRRPYFARNDARFPNNGNDQIPHSEQNP